MKKINLSVFFILIFFNGISENACHDGYMSPIGEDEDWGIGACKIPKEVEIPIYDTNLNVFGYLLKKNWQTTVYNKLAQQVDVLNFNSVTAISHESNSFIKIKKWKNSLYYHFNWKSKNGGYLLKKQDLIDNQVYMYSYRDLIIRDDISMHKRYYATERGTPIGVNVIKSCLKLRESPSLEGKSITCIPGNDWESEIKTRVIIKVIQENWALVNVEYIKPTTVECGEEVEWCCDSYPVQEVKEGWINFVDDNGFPNLWFAVSSSGY